METAQHHPIERLTGEFVLMLIATALLTLCARVVVPFDLNPMLSQALMILCVVFCIGAVCGCLVVVAYLLEGRLGLPAFAVSFQWRARPALASILESVSR